MQYEEPKVFNLLEADQREAAGEHLREEIHRVDGEIDETVRHQELLREVEAGLTEIQTLLERLREIAVQVGENPALDREMMSEKFDLIKAEIDRIASENTARWSAAESAQLRRMVAELSMDDF